MLLLRERGLLVEVLQNTPFDFFQRVALAQLVETEVPVCVRRFQPRIFQRSAALAVGLELVAHLAHHPDKISLGGGRKDGPVNVGPDGAPGG